MVLLVSPVTCDPQNFVDFRPPVMCDCQIDWISTVGLGIYGIKNQRSSYVLHLVVVPKNQLTTTVGHIHIYCIEKYLSELFFTFS